MSNFTIPVDSINTQTLVGRRKLIRELQQHRRKYEQTIDASASKYSKFFINELSKQRTDRRIEAQKPITGGLIKVNSIGGLPPLMTVPGEVPSVFTNLSRNQPTHST